MPAQVNSNTTYTLVGTPFSTFTRTIALGLTHKGLSFTQISTLPKTLVAFQYHPFGFLPTLVIHTVSDAGEKVDINLTESQAIARYIEQVAPTPSLASKSSNPITSAQLWEFASLAANSGFAAIEHGIVKPRVGAQMSGSSEAEIRKITADGIPLVQRFLAVMDERRPANATFAVSDEPTWADFFLFPLMADLKATPEWEEVKTLRFEEWMKQMEGLEAVKSTKAKTLSDGALPL